MAVPCVPHRAHFLHPRAYRVACPPDWRVPGPGPAAHPMRRLERKVHGDPGHASRAFSMPQPMVAAPTLVRYSALTQGLTMCPPPIAPTPRNSRQPHDRNSRNTSPRRCRSPRDRHSPGKPACPNHRSAHMAKPHRLPRGTHRSRGTITPSMCQLPPHPHRPPPSAIRDTPPRTQAGPCPTGRTSVSRPLWPFVSSVLNHPPVQQHGPHHGAKAVLRAAISESFSTQRTRRGTEGHGGPAPIRAPREGASMPAARPSPCVAAREHKTESHPGAASGHGVSPGGLPRRDGGT